MRLLQIGKYQFKKTENGYAALPAFGNQFWEKYLDVFEGIDILGEEIRDFLNVGTFSLITNPKIKVNILPANTNPKDFKNDFTVKKQLEEYIKKSEAILIKPSSRKGIMAIKIAKKYNKPYFIELTGDINLTLKNHTNILKRLYGPILYRQISKAIADCKYGLYVTEEYLQKVFPIEGITCGCTDTNILDPRQDVLEKRLLKIGNLTKTSPIKIGLIAWYHDTRKGIDTAIKALQMLNDNRISLHILGVGTEEDRNKWFRYAEKRNVKNQLVFDPPVSGVEKVLKWDEEIDIMILPSRSEGLPRSIVEAISVGCPCIISDVCGMPELVNSKWLHKPGDSKALCDLIKTMIDNPDEMTKAANENFKHSNNYTFSNLKAKRNNFLAEFKHYAESKRGQ